MKNFLIACSLSFFFLFIGCDDKVQFGGRVTYSDGAPVESGFVVFSTSAAQSRGPIEPDGTYKMSTMGNADGIPPGSYTVYLSGTDKRILKEQSDGNVLTTDIPQVDRKYTSPETSGLTFTIDGKEKRFDITVERYKK